MSQAPVKLSREQARRVTGGIGVVPCCPKCSSADIMLVNRMGREQHGRAGQEFRRFWKCSACGQEFDEPAVGFPQAI